MPFETPPTEAFSSETRAFTKMSFEDLQHMPETPHAAAPEPPPIHEEPPAFGGETRAFPRMSFEDLERMTEQPAPAPPPAPAPAESLPWEEQTPAFGGETRAFSSFSLDEPPVVASEPPPAVHEPESPFGEEMPAFGGETRAFTKMSFDDLQELAAPPAPEPAFEPEPEPEPQRVDSPVFEEPPPVSVFPAPAEEVPFEAPVEPEISSPPGAAAALSGDIPDEVIEKIARRVVQMLSADEVKKIAWEVIPDMAEMVVKERIRQLESEA
jgi:hypothetical protein